MDTVFTDKKLVEISVNLSLIGVLVLSQGMFTFASDARLAHIPSRPPDTGQVREKVFNEVSPEVRQHNFEDNIRKKYPKALIYDVTPGVKHIKLTKYYNGRPVKINIVEADLKIAKDLTLKPALSSNENLQSRRTISNIAKNSNAVAAINGTFFKPQTGVPLGTLMINKKMYTGPVYDRVALGIFDDGFDIARVQLNALIKSGKETIKVDNINQPRMLASYVLVYTPEWGKTAPASPKYGTQVAVEDGKVIQTSASALAIPQNGYVIVGPAQELNKIIEPPHPNPLPRWGEGIILEISTQPQWKDVKHIISGGPYLVKDNEVFVDTAAQKLASIGGRNPRSAIGYTADSSLIMAAVDGREESSAGLTLTELAGFMKSIGCTNAMNLDGGGSTVMYVNGKVVNSPAQQGGIPVSNAIVLAR
jgi:exopolysaccharide biosynthesis protein